MYLFDHVRTCLGVLLFFLDQHLLFGFDAKLFLKHISQFSSSHNFCCGIQQKLCDDENCEMCFKNSFASNPKSKCWSKKNNKTPRQVLTWSNKYIKFKCDICYHKFESILCSISDGTWCP